MGFSERSPTVVLRADSSSRIGFGHAMRCLALGQELVRRRWKVRLVACEVVPFVADYAQRSGIPVSIFEGRDDPDLEVPAIMESKPDFVLLDGYEFPVELFPMLDVASVPYGVVDDNGVLQPPNAQFLVNQNAHADESLYGDGFTGSLLLGFDYVMLRKEIRALRAGGARACAWQPPAILVAIGGTDLSGAGIQIAEYIASETDAEVFLAGPSQPVGVRRAPDDIASVLSSASVAVIGGGSSMWEACYLGVPAVALVVADNQAPAAMAAAKSGAVWQIDCRNRVDPSLVAATVGGLLASPQTRHRMSKLGSSLVDGRGVERVTHVIEEVLFG